MCFGKGRACTQELGLGLTLFCLLGGIEEDWEHAGRQKGMCLLDPGVEGFPLKCLLIVGLECVWTSEVVESN